MHLKKRECLRQRTRREEGSIGWVTGVFFVLFFMILLCAELQLAAYRASGGYLEDALAASNLASAIIDIETYGISHEVRIAESAAAYGRYTDAVKVNLQLDDSWQCANSVLISGPVTVERYIIYNVGKEAVEILEVEAGGRVRQSWGLPGNVAAPNGIPVTHTGIYSEISFPIKGFLGMEVQAHKGKLIDIVAEEKEDEQREGNT